MGRLHVQWMRHSDAVLRHLTSTELYGIAINVFFQPMQIPINKPIKNAEAAQLNPQNLEITHAACVTEYKNVMLYYEGIRSQNSGVHSTAR